MAPKFNKKEDPSQANKNKIDDQIKAYIDKGEKYIKYGNPDDAIKKYIKALEHIASKYSTTYSNIDPGTLSEEDQNHYFRATLKLTLIYANKNYKKNSKKHAQKFIDICSKSVKPGMHYQLGSLYLSPKFMLANTEKGKYHLSLAAKHDYKEAKQMLNQLENMEKVSIHHIEPEIAVEQRSNFDSVSVTSHETSSQLSTSNRTSLMGANTNEADWMSENMDSIKADAKSGDTDSQFTLGYMYENGIGFQRDISNAKKWYQRAVEKDHWDACCNLGYLYERDENYKDAFPLYLRAAQRDCTQAQYNVGSFYAQGRGTTKNKDEAFHWFKRAAIKGHYEALANTGYYFFKKGDFKNAEAYYKQAAKGGIIRANFALGYILEKNGGSREEVIRNYTKCDERNYLPGTNNLGCLYENEDMKEIALEYYKKAARSNHVLGKENMIRLSKKFKQVKDGQSARLSLKDYLKKDSPPASTHGLIRNEKDRSSSDSKGNSTYFIKQNLTHDVKHTYRSFEGPKKKQSDIDWYELGLISEYAKPGFPDNTSALQYYFKAENNPAAFYKLASMYYLAHGVNYDIDEAIKHLEKAKTISIRRKSRFIYPLEEDPDTINDSETEFCVKTSSQLLAEIYCALGYLYGQKGDHFNQIKHFIMASYMGCTEAKEEVKEIIHQQNLLA